MLNCVVGSHRRVVHVPGDKPALGVPGEPYQLAHAGFSGVKDGGNPGIGRKLSRLGE